MTQSELNNLLMEACELGHVLVAKLLLEQGADVHARDDCALRWAAYHGYIETVKLLLEHGANVHVCNGYVLGWAAYYGHTETVKLLEAYMKGE